MHDGGHARRARPLQIGAQPRELRRALTHRHVRVQRDDVPAAEIERVVPQPGGAGALAEVVEIRRRARRLVFVVAGSRVGARLVTAPGAVVALEVRRIALHVGVVAGGEHRAGNVVQQLGRRFRAWLPAHVDVAGANQDRFRDRGARKRWRRRRHCGLRARTACRSRRSAWRSVPGRLQLRASSGGAAAPTRSTRHRHGLSRRRDVLEERDRADARVHADDPAGPRAAIRREQLRVVHWSCGIGASREYDESSRKAPVVG